MKTTVGSGSTVLQAATPLYAAPVSNTAAAARPKQRSHALSPAGALAVTTTPAAILVHNALSQHCVMSIPATSGTSFSAPALFIAENKQKMGHANAEKKNDDDGDAPSKTGDDNEDDDQTPGTNADDDADSVSPAETEQKAIGAILSVMDRTLQVWKVDSTKTDSSTVVASRKFENSVHAVSTLSLNGDSSTPPDYIAVVETTGHVRIVEMALDQVLASWVPPAMRDSKSKSTVVFTRCMSPKDVEVGTDNDVAGDAQAVLVQVLRHDLAESVRPTWTTRVLTVCKTSSRSVVVVLQDEIEIDLDDATPLSFASDAASKRLGVVTSNCQAVVLPLASDANSSPSVIKIDLSRYMDTCVKGKSVASPTALAFVGTDHLAVLTQNKQQDTLTMWELKFRSLQAEQLIGEVDTENTAERGACDFSLEETTLPTIGDVLLPLVTVADRDTVSTRAYIVPYHCAPVTLLNALGRMQPTLSLAARAASASAATVTGAFQIPLVTVARTKPPAFAIVTASETSGQSVPDADAVSHNCEALSAWVSDVAAADRLDTIFLAKIADPKQTETVQSFNQTVAAWIYARHVAACQRDNVDITKKEKEIVTGDDSRKMLIRAFSLNAAKDMSHVAVMVLACRCFVNPAEFWPREVVEHLITTGVMTSRAAASAQGALGGLIDTLLAMYEYALVEMALSHVSDIPETDRVSILHHVCCTLEGSDEVNAHRTRVLDAMYERRRPDHHGAARFDSQVEADAAANARKADSSLTKSNDAQEDQASLKKDHQQQNEEGDASREVQALPNSTVGQNHFFYLVMHNHGNDVMFTRALRKGVTHRDLCVILSWISQTAAPKFKSDLDVPEQRFPLWWLWTQDTSAESQAYREWYTAVDALSLVLDAHLTAILLDPRLEPIVGRLHAVIRRDLRLMQLYDSRLRGPLLSLTVDRTQMGDTRQGHGNDTVPMSAIASHAAYTQRAMTAQQPATRSNLVVPSTPAAVSRHNKLTAATTTPGDSASATVAADSASERLHGKRWRMLLHQAQNGVGDYDVEVLRIQS